MILLLAIGIRILFSRYTTADDFGLAGLGLCELIVEAIFFGAILS